MGLLKCCLHRRSVYVPCLDDHCCKEENGCVGELLFARKLFRNVFIWLVLGDLVFCGLWTNLLLRSQKWTKSCDNRLTRFDPEYPGAAENVMPIRMQEHLANCRLEKTSRVSIPQHPSWDRCLERKAYVRDLFAKTSSTQTRQLSTSPKKLTQLMKMQTEENDGNESRWPFSLGPRVVWDTKRRTRLSHIVKIRSVEWWNHFVPSVTILPWIIARGVDGRIPLCWSLVQTKRKSFLLPHPPTRGFEELQWSGVYQHQSFHVPSYHPSVIMDSNLTQSSLLKHVPLPMLTSDHSFHNLSQRECWCICHGC